MSALKYKIWCPDVDSEEDAKEIEILNASHLEDSVERYARRDWSNSDYWERAEFRVEFNGKTRRFVVTAEQTVDFSVEELEL